ncbi:hypothetical protein CMI37_37220 [Candidatus Pacearchaeota archaeon]|nr:hypothetical protein [Candidatus Pacearchaeota archaeon]|tara:strand:+ start:2978 stop:3439 length:462 start_codon:yes stop_codon:yes gene_type:complete
MTTITLDGIKTRLVATDLDGDGITGGVEKITQKFSDSVTNITQGTELEGSLKELNADAINAETRMSQIDMRTRLASFEISAVLAVDSLVALGVLPQKCLPLSTQKKRLNVSQAGKGREEMVQLVAGKREQDAKVGAMGGFTNGVKSFFGVGNK